MTANVGEFSRVLRQKVEIWLLTWPRKEFVLAIPDNKHSLSLLASVVVNHCQTLPADASHTHSHQQVISGFMGTGFGRCKIHFFIPGNFLCLYDCAPSKSSRHTFTSLNTPRYHNTVWRCARGKRRTRNFRQCPGARVNPVD